MIRILRQSWRYTLMFVCLMLTLAACKRDFLNPYDSQTPPDTWMPSAFNLDTLDQNSLVLSWLQAEQLIDGFVIQKIIDGQTIEILLPLDSMQYIDTVVVDSIINLNCPEVTYKLMARAGGNRSLDVKTTNLRFPITTKANAGNDQIISTNEVQALLMANVPFAGETGRWSILNGEGGALADSNSSTTTFTGNSCSTYTLRWLIQGKCESNFDDVVISFQQASTTANAGSDQTITSNLNQVNLAANIPAPSETGQWFILNGEGGAFANSNSPTTTFTGNSCSTYTLRWLIQGECESDFDDVAISFQQGTTIANAGIDQTLASNVNQVVLSANVPENNETGQWIIVSGIGGVFTNSNIHNSIFTGVIGSTYILRWSITGVCNTTSDDVTISLPELAFPGEGISDIDGNFYPTITLSNGQEWTALNLRTTRFCNGDVVPNVTGLNEWPTLSTGAWSIYNNDSQYEGILGNLYNWFAVSDARNICPCGWHVANNTDWNNLINLLGGDYNSVGSLLKSATWGGEDVINFKAEPDGTRLGDNGYFFGLNTMAVWWSSTSQNANQAIYYQLVNSTSQLLTGSDLKSNGNTIRCVRN